MRRLFSCKICFNFSFFAIKELFFLLLIMNCCHLISIVHETNSVASPYVLRLLIIVNFTVDMHDFFVIFVILSNILLGLYTFYFFLILNQLLKNVLLVLSYQWLIVQVCDWRNSLYTSAAITIYWLKVVIVSCIYLSTSWLQTMMPLVNSCVIRCVNSTWSIILRSLVALLRMPWTRLVVSLLLSTIIEGILLHFVFKY